MQKLSRLAQKLHIRRPKQNSTTMSGGLIFITGGTGYVGSKVLDVTLREGHRVRLSVRKESQVQTVKDRFPEHVDKLSFAIIADITQADAIRPALDGVDHIFHLASPMAGKAEDFKTDYAEPAVAGTE
jgi:nucleoside-diphosphate-sugar epimerase